MIEEKINIKSEKSQKSSAQTMKGFKQTEVGLIPEDWEVKKLGEVTTIIGGGTPSTNLSKYWNGKINWFTPTEIGYMKFIYESKRKISEDGLKNSSAKLLPVGTILLTTRATIGEVSILGAIGTTNQGFQNLIANSDVNNEYLYYLIKIIKNKLIQFAKGSTFTEISSSSIKAITIPLPPTKAEQTAIATVLSDTDALIEKLEQLIAKKRLIKQGAMQELLKPKEGWEVKKLGEVVDISKGQLITEKTAIPDGIPVIGGGMVISYYHNKPNRNGITITISASGAYAGYVSIHNYPIFASDCSTISESDEYDIYYLYFSLLNKQREIYALQTGGGQPHVYPQQLRDLFIPIPKDKSEQTRIAQILSDMEAEIEALEKQLEKYKKLKQGMMQVLLTGKIRLV